MEIKDIDKNFAVVTALPFDDIQYINCEEAPFKIYGVFKENGVFRRIPEAVAKATSVGVYKLHDHAAGGRIRFQTNSNYIALNAKMPQLGKMPHFALTGSIGFDIYIKRQGVDSYYNSFVPPFDVSDGYESYVTFPDNSFKEVTIHFPLYSSVSELYIGVQNSAQVLPPENYQYETPIVYYGSSITQGGCASRPGNSYEAIISRRLDTNYINLGFSGNAKAEDTLMDYIKNLDMSIFVYDYDHNAPSAEYLKSTHEKGFLAIREANPTLPIILMPRPKYYPLKKDDQRREIIKATYDNAVKNGDKNTFFIDGKTLMQLAGNDGTVDNCHPNDLGFHSMAKVLGDVIEKILKP